EGALVFARKVIDTRMPLRKVRDLNDKIEAARGHPEIFDKARRDYARRYRGFEAWKAVIRATEAAVDLPFDEGMKREREEFMNLVLTPQARAQRYVFFAERKVWKVADVPDTTPTLPIKKVGVIGAGTMGGGISMNFLNVGIPVTIVETAQPALDRGLATIRRNYENTAKKVAILASNASYLNIDEIASVTSRPDHVLGMHFFSPANVMRLLEVVRGEKTAKPV